MYYWKLEERVPYYELVESWTTAFLSVVLEIGMMYAKDMSKNSIESITQLLLISYDKI